LKICLSCEGVSDTPADRCGFCGARLHGLDAVHYPARRGEIDATNPLLGSVVDGKYRLLGVLGRGGLGTVFRAQHVGSLMTVALKLLHPRFADRPEYRRALVPEARRAATVADERCARLLDVGEAEDGAAYLAMELVEGRTLDELVRDGPLAPAHAVAVLEQVAGALAAIHAAGLVHCDLSPRNVMVAVRGGALHVKVLDFGIARTVTLAGPSRAPGELHGFVNPAYAAPELLDGRDVDARADLYSFGVLAWQLLTGGLPVDDADVRRMVAAVVAGERRPWPPTRGVGRRLRRLIAQCLMRDPGARPQASAAVARQLAILRGARRPALVRAGVAAVALGAFAVAATAPASEPFLQAASGSVFALAPVPLDATAPAIDTTSARLTTLRFDCGGFAPERLRAQLVHDGDVVLRVDQRPEVDAEGGVLALAMAQAPWRETVEALARTGQQHASDLVFLTPGSAPFGGVRLRVDDVPPRLAVDPVAPLPVLRQDTRVRWRVEEAVGLQRLQAEVRCGGELVAVAPLPPAAAEFALGEDLAARGLAADGRAGVVAIVAVDRAGNVAQAEALAFAALDVAAPTVLAVTGPGGEAFVPVAGGLARARVRLGAAEVGGSIVVEAAGEIADAMPWPDGVDSMLLDVPVGAAAGSSRWRLSVRDAAGNQRTHDVTVALRNVELAVTFARCGGPARTRGDELVVAAGGSADVVLADDWRVESAALRRAGAEVVGGAWSWQPAGDAAIRFTCGDLPPGAYALQLRVRGHGESADLAATATAALRVLPARLAVRAPTAPRPFLPALLAAGVLAPQPASEGAPVAYGAGPAWSVDAELRPYLRGRAVVDLGDPASPVMAAPIDLEAAGEMTPLLPDLRPLPGRNVVRVAYEDVLGRPVALLVGGVEAASGVPATVVDFWWSDVAPQLVGEEVLVEHGQPVRVRLRAPLPFAARDRDDLRLAAAATELPAADVRPLDGDRAEVDFVVPFAVWRAAARLDDVPRAAYADGIERRLDVGLATPAGRHALALRLRTVRSTLQPLALGDVRPLPPALAALRFVPVLAPSTPFVEPLPAAGPPRAAYRPQPVVQVRNLADILLQADEFRCGAARALAAQVGAIAPLLAARCVRADDPLGAGRMTAAALLPATAADLPDDAPLAGVDFHQASALARLLGLVVVGDPDAARLPLGCELELAAFTGAMVAAGHGAAAHGSAVAAWPFRRDAGRADGASYGDRVPTDYGVDFVGLDFGLREWVLDLPATDAAAGLLGEWMSDHAVHLRRADDLAVGRDPLVLAAVGPARRLAVARGVACREGSVLLGRAGAPIDPGAVDSLPPEVPGVLRTEQLRRDGGDLLSTGADPRLRHVGFRVVLDPAGLRSLEAER
jgi:predicted Ser/Thr protein kinase